MVGERVDSVCEEREFCRRGNFSNSRSVWALKFFVVGSVPSTTLEIPISVFLYTSQSRIAILGRSVSATGK